jgi:hypothetical protein
MPVNETRFPTVRVPIVECAGKEPWGIEQGRVAFAKLDASLRDRSESIVNIDLRGVVRLDSSCAREIITNALRKYVGVRWFFVSGVENDSVKENVDAAMLRSEVSILLRLPKNAYLVLGVPLKDHLKATLDVVEKRGPTTSKDVAAHLKEKLALPACINRLKDLVDAGLVMRVEGAAESGGREFLYVALR